MWFCVVNCEIFIGSRTFFPDIKSSKTCGNIVEIELSVDDVLNDINITIKSNIIDNDFIKIGFVDENVYLNQGNLQQGYGILIEGNMANKMADEINSMPGNIVRQNEVNVNIVSNNVDMNGMRTIVLNRKLITNDTNDYQFNINDLIYPACSPIMITVGVGNGTPILNGNEYLIDYSLVWLYPESNVDSYVILI